MELTFIFVVLAVVFVFYLAAYRQEAMESYDNGEYSNETFNDIDLALNKVIEKGGISVVIDEMSWDYLAGSEIGYKQELIGSYFSIENPNAASTCGCGTSFALL